MSLKKNIVASYASQIYVTLVGIITLPFYIRYMGAEAYGLVGFFTMLQTWFALLDFGLTPTIARETARFWAGSYDALSYRRLFRALHILFLVIAFAGGIALFSLSDYISFHWLNVKTLDRTEVTFAVQIMAISVALRWMTGLYRGVVTGSERLVWLSGFNAFIASLRFLGIFPILWHFGTTPSVFFQYQLLIAILELFGLWVKSSKIISTCLTHEKIGFSISPIKHIIGFSIKMSLAISIWLVASQIDKLIISTLLDLEKYGHFILITMVSNAIMLITTPIGSALSVRMIILQEQKNEIETINIYLKATRIIATIGLTSAIIIMLFSEYILYAWTGDKNLSSTIKSTLSLYAIGSGFLSLSSLAYYIQYAKGTINLHILGSSLYAIISLILTISLVRVYGMIGAGYSWAIVNALYFILWIAIAHYNLNKILHKQWLNTILQAIIPILLFTIPLYLLKESGLLWEINKTLIAIILSFLFIIIITLNIPDLRIKIKNPL